MFGIFVSESVMYGNDRAERDRQTDIQTYRQRETETDRLTDRQGMHDPIPHMPARSEIHNYLHEQIKSVTFC